MVHKHLLIKDKKKIINIWFIKRDFKKLLTWNILDNLIMDSDILNKLKINEL